MAVCHAFASPGFEFPGFEFPDLSSYSESTERMSLTDPAVSAQTSKVVVLYEVLAQKQLRPQLEGAGIDLRVLFVRSEL